MPAARFFAIFVEQAWSRYSAIAIGAGAIASLSFFDPHTPVLNDLTYLGVGLVLSYGAASLSWFLFESQILRAKRWFSAHPAQGKPSAITAQTAETAEQPVPNLVPAVASSAVAGAQG